MVRYPKEIYSNTNGYVYILKMDDIILKDNDTG